MCPVEAVRMKIVLAVVLILAIVGSTLADEGELCTVESNDTKPLESKIFNMAFRCLAPDKTELDRLKDSTQPELVHAFFKNYCNNKTIHQNCLEEVKVKSHACLNESRHQAFLTIKEVLESIQNTGCQNEGELMATVFNGYQNLTDHGDYLWRCCYGYSRERLRLINRGENFGVPAELFLVYNEMMVIRDCVKYHTPETEDAFRGAVDRFINEIQNTMKCIHPQDNSRVLCKTVDVDTTDGLRYCPITREKDETQTMHEIILHRMKACLKDAFPFNDTLYEAKDLDSYRHYFKDHCFLERWDIEECIHKATMLSKMCSNKSEHESFKTVGDFMMKGIDHVCLAWGEPISLVMYSLQEGHENTEESEKPLMRCLLAAKSSLDGIFAEDTHEQKRAFYRVLGSFKGCVVEQLRGHNKAVFYAEQLLNLFLRSLKCVDPENEHHVKCEALSQPPPTETRVCPFVSGRETDPNQYAMFVDMGFTCLTALVPISDLDEYESLEAFRIFFRWYCNMDTVNIENCMKDMDAIGKVCFTADEHQMNHIFIDMVNTSIKSGCVGNGGNLASVMYGMKKYKDALEPCKVAMTKGIREIEKHHGNTTTVSMEQFRLVNTFTECYSSNVPDEGEFKTDNLAFMRAVLKHLECVHPDGSTVSCETIVNDVHAD